MDSGRLTRSWLPVAAGKIFLIAALFAGLVACEASEPLARPFLSEAGGKPSTPNIVIIRV